MADVTEDACRLWLFDVDGTLVEPSEGQLHAWIAAFQEVFGLQVSAAAITGQLGQTFAEIVGAVVRAHGRPDPSPRLQEARAAYTRQARAVLARRPARLLPGARELLDFLKGRGNTVGVVTGNFPEEGEPKLERTGLRGVLDLVVFADLGTPARDALLRQALNAARARGFRGDFADTVVVGDSVHDIASAHRMGALAIAVCTGLTPSDVLAAAGPDLLVRDLSGLLSILRRTGAAWVPTSRHD